ncbi:receptor-type adenylate cyclase, putative [Bodo saltans]|uniref:adenylate cyclase n=1 Tax=Bodo saltans TaxID=75058 RepID=A0A0S4IZX2_BODSA|nr:receptor-type adenylate cyclase, putative [Bodo saltans]|eukprot:CUG71318.1 receptor-type adenylate cyclase, putative [Bodo saltans]
MWTAWNPTGAAATMYSAFVTLIRQQSVVYNSANQLPSSLISAVVMNDIMPYLPGESNRVYFNRVYATRRPVFMIGEEFLNVSAPIVNVVVASTVVLEDPPLAAATNFSQYTWNLEAVFADLAHVMSNYIADTYSKQPHRVVVLSDEDASQDLAVKSLHTFQINPEVPAVRSLATLATMLDLVNDAAATAAAGTRTIVMVASRDPAVFVVALNAVTTIPDAADASSRFAKNFVIVLPANPEFLYQSVVSVNASALQNVPILFPSAYMPFWEPGNAFRVRAASLLNVSTASPILSVSSLYVSIVMFDLFTTLAVAANTQLPFAEDIVSVMYDVSTVTLNGVVLGPVYNATCSTRILASQSAERTCQCYKLLRTYGVYDFRDWLMSTATHQLDYTWTISTCEVTYKPLIVETTLNKGLVAGCATAGGLVFIAAIFYFACCFGRRNNRCAPKNPSEPFAMVFTDIQSSTALWARAPEAMGESLDQHHSMLRHLVLKYNGYEVKTIGDSFMVAFKNATNATQFALAVQMELFAAQWAPDIDDVYIALASEAHEEKMIAEDPKKAEERRMNNIGKLYQWEDTLNYPLNWNGIRVRVGMHWGMGSIKLDPVSQGYDYYGTLVNTAARVEGVGNGGQVLATNDFYVQLEHEQMNLVDVDVKPLGPQPLRGLDQPVPLYQLSPTALRSREFADLRLDVEIDVDTTDSSAHTASSAPADDTPLILMARLLKHQKNSGPMYDYLTRVLQFMDTLLRTSPIAHRKDALKHYLKKWHVTPRKPRDTKESAEVTLSFDLAALVVRVGLASEEAHGNSSHGSQANKEDAISGRSGLRRKQSYSNVIRVQSVNSYENTAAAPEHPL